MYAARRIRPRTQVPLFTAVVVAFAFFAGCSSSKPASTATTQPASSASAVAVSSPTGNCTHYDDIRVMIFAGLLNNMLTFVAKDAGFFHKNCLNATLVPVASGPAGISQVLSGDLQFSDSSFDNVILARAKGLAIRVVTGESTGVAYALTARKSLPLPDLSKGYPAVMKNLVGKKIGVFGLGTGSELFVRALFQGAGLSPDSATYIGVGSVPTQLTALQNGSVDAIMTADPGDQIAVQEGFGQVVVNLATGEGPSEVRTMGGTFQVKVASEAYLKSHADVARRFVEAYREANAWVHDPANLDALARIMVARAGVATTVPNAEQLNRQLAQLWAGHAGVDVSRASVDAWEKFETHFGNLKSPVSFSDVVWAGAPTAP